MNHKSDIKWSNCTTKDFAITIEQSRWLKHYFQRSATQEEKQQARAIIKELLPDTIGDRLCENIVDGVSYDKLLCREWIPLNRNSFYCKRLTCVAMIMKRMNLGEVYAVK